MTVRDVYKIYADFTSPPQQSHGKGPTLHTAPTDWLSIRNVGRDPLAFATRGHGVVQRSHASFVEMASYDS